MNRHGLADLNRREFSRVQLEVVCLYRANGTFKEWGAMNRCCYR